MKRPAPWLHLLAATLLLTGLAACGDSPNTPTTPIVLLSTGPDLDAAKAQTLGVLQSRAPRSPLIDLPLEIRPQDRDSARYLLAKTVASFPAGTVFLITTPTGTEPARHLALATKSGKFLVGPDNGLLSQVMQREGVAAVRELSEPKLYRNPKPARGFAARDILAPVAAHLATGGTVTETGPALHKPVLIPAAAPTVLGSSITGEIVHIDHTGTVVTNLGPQHVREIKPGHLIRVTLRGRPLSVPYVETLAEAPKGRILAMLNGDGELEFILPGAAAQDLLKVKVGERVIVNY
jgi:S-adenosylmethionine hydrolase